ncbi:hypothetical protein V6Z11_A08G041500 [Gossypium hirsutum]
MAKAQRPHIAILPSPGMGHLIPLVEFAKRLVHQHSFTVTFVIPTDGSPSKALKSTLDSLPTFIDSVFLPPVDLSDLPPDSKIETGMISLTAFMSMYKDMVEPVRFPGCISIHGNELLDPTQDRKNDAYKWLLHHANRFRSVKGIMALQAKQSGCIKWLDIQPVGSVLFVSFGSSGTLSRNQVSELAMGLEMSKQRFLWVITTPNDTIANATYINVDTQKDDDPFMFLPKGFVERTKERSLVVGSWVPQARVLNHGSTGGFLTHCGWNQFLKMNALMLSEDAKVALRPKPNKNGLICRDEIAKIVKCLMGSEEGKSVRNRMLELKEAAKRVLCENGSSTIALSEVADSINHPLLSTS